MDLMDLGATAAAKLPQRTLGTQNTRNTQNTQGPRGSSSEAAARKRH